MGWRGLSGGTGFITEYDLTMDAIPTHYEMVPDFRQSIMRTLAREPPEGFTSGLASLVAPSRLLDWLGGFVTLIPGGSLPDVSLVMG